MVLEPIAVQVFGLITAKTAPVVVEFLGDQIAKVLRRRASRGKGEIEALKREVEELKSRIEAKSKADASDISRVEKAIQEAFSIQKETGLELVSDQAHLKWILERFRGLERMRQGTASFNVSVWAERGTLSSPRDIAIVPKLCASGHRVGDSITLFFRSDSDCYITLVNLGTSGKITVLFPNRLSQDNFVSANQTYSIPKLGFPFQYRLEGPPGVEIVKAIATIAKVDLLDLNLSSTGEVFYSEARSAAARDINIIETRLEELSFPQWATGTCEFAVS